MANLIYGWIPKPGGDTRGSGKTGGMIHHLHQKKLQGRKVLTNLETVVFQDDKMTADKLRDAGQELFHACIGLSEVHQFMESRRSMKGDQIQTSYGISQVRKLRCETHWDSQAVHKVDRRLIDETDVLIHCENLGCGDIECANQSCGIQTCGIFHYEVFHRRTARYGGEFWLNGPKDFYNLFNSEEFIQDFYTDEQE